MKSLNYYAYIIIVIIVVWEWGVNGAEERKEEGWKNLGALACVL